MKVHWPHMTVWAMLVAIVLIIVASPLDDIAAALVIGKIATSKRKGTQTYIDPWGNPTPLT